MIKVKVPRLIQNKFIEFALIGLILGYSGSVSAEGFLPDKQEILMMPQLCQWMYGARAGLAPSLIPRSPSMDVSGCTRFHYYCDAHTDLVRAEESAYTNPGRAKEKLSRAINTLKGQVQFHDAEPGCSKYLRADISYTLGKALQRYARLTRSPAYSSQAIAPLLRAIELTPDDVRPYQALGDVYVALNKRKEAEDAIYKGLEISPESKPLLRRYKELGGKRPLPTPKPAIPVETGNGEDAEHLEAGQEPARAPKALPSSAADSAKPSQENSALGDAVQQKAVQADQDKSNPARYCRFCADDDGGSGKAAPAPAPAQPGLPTEGAGKLPCRFCP